MIKANSSDKQSQDKRHWQAHVKALNSSGLSRAEYCRQHTISYHALTYWQRKLSKSDPVKPTLVPVVLPPEAGKKVAGASLHLILPGRISIAVDDGFSAATLDKLLSVLEKR